jgi:hypothetical protein
MRVSARTMIRRQRRLGHHRAAPAECSGATAGLELAPPIGWRRMPNTAEHHRARAAKARRLADALPAADPTRRALLELAEAFDTMARAAELAERGRS